MEFNKTCVQNVANQIVKLSHTSRNVELFIK